MDSLKCINSFFFNLNLLFSSLALAQAVTCINDEFQCNQGQCITERWLCDGDSDCPSGEDELNCKSGKKLLALGITLVCFHIIVFLNLVFCCNVGSSIEKSNKIQCEQDAKIGKTIICHH